MQKYLLGTRAAIVGLLVLWFHNESSEGRLRRLDLVNQKEPAHWRHVNATIGFIHVGKCGGTAIMKTINKVPNAIKERGVEPFHMIHPRIKRYQDWIGTVRDPVERIISNWVYEHPQNAKYRNIVNTSPDKNEAFKRNFYGCYKTLDEALIVGLVEPSMHVNDCPMIAKKVFSGRLDNRNAFTNRMPHSTCNYKYYYHNLLREASSKRIFIIRNEFMLHDLNSIQRMLGDTDYDAFTSIEHDLHFKVKKEKLSVSNKYISEKGMSNLCAYLCEEIQIYKLVLRLARNLSPEYRSLPAREMLPELFGKCPSEVDLEVTGHHAYWQCSELARKKMARKYPWSQ